MRYVKTLSLALVFSVVAVALFNYLPDSWRANPKSSTMKKIGYGMVVWPAPIAITYIDWLEKGYDNPDVIGGQDTENFLFESSMFFLWFAALVPVLFMGSYMWRRTRRRWARENQLAG